MGGEGGGAAGVVDNVSDFALIAQCDGNHVMKTNAGFGGDFDGVGEQDVRAAENTVGAESPGFVGCDGVGDFVRGPAFGARSAREAGLVGRIVGNLGLIEVGAAAVAVPKDLELLMVFNEEAIGCNVVAVDDEAVSAGIRVPSDTGSMIGAPDPGVVDDGVVAVDFEIDYGATDSGASDAEEYIVERDGIFCVSGMTFVWTHLKQDRRRRWAGIEEEAGDDDSVFVSGRHGGRAVDRVQRGESETHHDGVGAIDADRFGQLVDAWRKEKVLAMGELRIDGCSIVTIGVGDVELTNGDGFSWRGRCMPRDAGAVAAQRRTRTM